MNADSQGVASGLSVVLIGLGNIGSQVVPLLAGINDVTRVILVDHDRYGASNLGSQRITSKDVGQLKVKVQRRVLRALAPHIGVDTYACRVEAAPPGRLRDCVVLACVDSRAARQAINRIAFRLGIPWIDAGLDRTGSVRARAYVPDIADCLECNWGEADYAQLDQRMPCDGAPAAAIATSAPMELGSIAAGLQVALLRRVVTEGIAAAGHELARQQWFLDVPSGKGWIGRYAGRNPDCRFNHERWRLTPLRRSARDITLGETLALTGADTGRTTFSVEGQMIIERVRCAKCRTVKSVGGRILGRMKAVACPRCGRAMTPAALDGSDSLSAKTTSADWLARPLAAFGLVDGDVITLHAEGATMHVEVGSANTEAH